MSPEDEAELLREYEQWQRDRRDAEPDLSVVAFVTDRGERRVLNAAAQTLAYLREVAFTDVERRPSAADVAEHVVVGLFGESLS